MNSRAKSIIASKITVMIMLTIIMVIKKMDGWYMPWLWVFSPIWMYFAIDITAMILQGFIGMGKNETEERI